MSDLTLSILGWAIGGVVGALFVLVPSRWLAESCRGTQQLRQLRDVRRDPSRLVLREQLGR